MRTEIERRYKTGFLLAEQELRRIVQSCQEHAAKIGAKNEPKITVKLKDGALVECNSADDVLSLENGGQKSIIRLTLMCKSEMDEPDKVSMIKINFEDGT